MTAFPAGRSEIFLSSARERCLFRIVRSAEARSAGGGFDDEWWVGDVGDDGDDGSVYGC